MQPKDYQRTGIDFLKSRRRALLGDDAGLGKSMQMIRAADELGIQQIVIACPAIGRVSWVDQLQKWQTIPRPVHVYDSKTKLANVFRPGNEPAVLIVSYDMLASETHAGKIARALDNTQEPLFQYHDRLLILDEAHALKSDTAQRTKRIYGNLRLHARHTQENRAVGLHSRFEYVWAASATFTPNHAGEWYPHIQRLFPDVLETIGLTYSTHPQRFEDFVCRVRATNWGRQITGNNDANTLKLMDALRPHYLARKKAEVLKELDPMHCVELPLGLSVTQAVHPVFDSRQMVEAINAAEALGLDPLDVFNTVRTGAHFMAARRELGVAKAEAAWPWIKAFLEDNPGKKLVVFAHHRDVIEQLHAALAANQISFVSVTGDTGPSTRFIAVNHFQHDTGTRVFVGQIKACSTSITLTAASDVLILEPDFTPAINYQAISRCHRIGQTGLVTAYFAVADREIDRRIVSILRRKTADLATMYGETPGMEINRSKTPA
jgi:SWI/SNF-related matrix-associated actin-dependent regulator of chromatin subfamily A-like protein 1